MSRFGCAAILMVGLLVNGSAVAAPVTIAGDNPRDSITVIVENTGLHDVLRDLSAKYGFAVNGLENAQDSDALTATMSGSLQSIIERLLRNRNHVIVRSPDNACGIAKVMILDTSYGSLPPRPGGTAATQKDSDDALLQAQSNGS